MVERLAASEDDRADGIVGHHHGEARLLAQEDVQVGQEGAASGEDDALVDDVGRELGRRLLQRQEDGLDDRVRRLGQRFPDLVGVTMTVLGTPRIAPFTSVVSV